MFPKTAEELLDMLLLQKANLPKYQTETGADAADITSVGEDAANLEYALEYAALIEANKKTVNKIKNALYEGEESEGIADAPVFPAFAPPFALKAGCEDRARERNGRFKRGKGYTPEIGFALGMESDAEAPALETLKPKCEPEALAVGYKMLVYTSKMGMDSFKVQIRHANTEIWTDAATGTFSPLEVTVQPTTAGAPVRVEVRVILLKKNQAVGQPSDGAYVTLNP